MLMMIRRTLLWACAALAAAAMSFGALIFWPDPLFAFSLRAGKIIVASDRPIPPAGGERFLHDCERLLERSPLKAQGREYRPTLQTRTGDNGYSFSCALIPGASRTHTLLEATPS